MFFSVMLKNKSILFQNKIDFCRFGIIGILSLVEICRRSVGLPILIIAGVYL